MREHPGWKKGGTVIRDSTKLVLNSNGAYLNHIDRWMFNAVEEFPSRTIFPLPEDIYVSPSSKESNMISRNWIVVSSLNGPSHKPIQHTTEQNAIDEAKRLALKNPSDKFFVYELRRAFQVESVKEIEVDSLPF